MSGDSWDSPYHPLVQILGWIVAILLSLETVIGNAMVVIAYRIDRSISKQVNNKFIVSLAVSDLIIGIEGIPLFSVYVINGDRWPLGSIACETWLFLDYTLCLVSILTVLLITVDRYLSVCHTAEYLKWQNPSRIKSLIAFSWIMPAFFFGVMIYGWPYMSSSDEGPALSGSSNGECFAPFLANPYVNMSMYITYYWTTLVAMLILYQGIHKAAKKLESKAKAKEHRHIALLLTQRLGTQVGVSLMLHSQRQKELQEDAQQPCAPNNQGHTDTLSVRAGAEELGSKGLRPSSLRLPGGGDEKLAKRSFRERVSNSLRIGVRALNTKSSRRLVARTAVERAAANAVEKSTKLTELNTTNVVLDPTEPVAAALVPDGCSDQEQPQEENKEYMDRNVASGDAASCKSHSSASKASDGFMSVPASPPHASLESLSETFNDDSLSSVLQFNHLSIFDAFATDSALAKPDTISPIVADSGKGRISRRHSSRENPQTSSSKRNADTAPVAKNPQMSSTNVLEVPPVVSPTAAESDEEGTMRRRILEQLFGTSRRPSFWLRDSKGLRQSGGRQRPPSAPSLHASHVRSQQEVAGGDRQRERQSWHALVETVGRRVSRLLPVVSTPQQLPDTSRPNVEQQPPPKSSMLTTIRPASITIVREEPSSSARSGDSSGHRNDSVRSRGVMKVSLVAISRKKSTRASLMSNISNVAEDDSDGKMSTGDRLMSAIFSPISTYKKRKRTRAEMRAQKAFRTITFIVGLFAILWSPYYVVATIYGFCKEGCVSPLLYTVAYYMCYLNSSMNPFAYALANRQFRSAFGRMFRGNFNRPR